MPLDMGSDMLHDPALVAQTLALAREVHTAVLARLPEEVRS